MTGWRRPVWWALAGVVAVLVVSATWIVVRGLMARDALLGALPLASQAREAVGEADPENLDRLLDELTARAHTAAELTSDPVWRAGEVVPWAGANLRAAREAAQVIEDAAEGALPPLRRLAGAFPPSGFAAHDGRFDLEPFREAAPLLHDARAALDSARATAAQIDADGTLPQIQESVDELLELLDESADLVAGLDAAASVLPGILGGDGPREYLLLSLNNAELRATGGIPGALATIRADDGVLTLGERAFASTFGAFESPVLPLTATEQTLYDDFPGRFIQNVTMTPDFQRTGELAAEMWELRMGTRVDGVLALDPVVVSYLLGALGPVDAGGGITIDAENAVAMLLDETYRRLPDPVAQDHFFARVLVKLFDRVSAGPADDRAFVDALVRSADEQRIHFWSAHPDEQDRLAGSTFATALPVSTARTLGLGVYFNDATAAKMDFYLRAAVGVSTVVCRHDDRPYVQVRVSLTSTAPADAGAKLPAAVTGGGSHGVPPGDIRTNVYVFAPPGTTFYGATAGGVERAFLAAEDSDAAVGGQTVTVSPGVSVDLTFSMLAPAGAPTVVTLNHTPMAAPVVVSLDGTLECPVVVTPGVDVAASIAE